MNDIVAIFLFAMLFGAIAWWSMLPLFAGGLIMGLDFIRFYVKNMIRRN